MTDKRETRAWVDIDLDALAHNYSPCGIGSG